MGYNSYTMDVKILIIMLAAAMALLLIVWRFSDGRYGRLRPSGEAAEAFETFRIAPGKEYYISGADLCPNAIIGIDKSWILETDLWKKRDLTAEAIRELVGNMRSRAMEQTAFPQGFDILDDRGAKIGEWYSLPGLNIAIRIKGENRLYISTPPLETYPNR